jgi:hypothetical protein
MVVITPMTHDRRTILRGTVLTSTFFLAIFAANPVGRAFDILDLVVSDEPPASLDAPRHRARYLVKPNPIQISNGLALDGAGSLYIDRVLRNSIVKYDLATGATTEIASVAAANPR